MITDEKYVSIPIQNSVVCSKALVFLNCLNPFVHDRGYDKIPLDERIYRLCSGNKIENERHLLLDCQRYSSTKGIFLFN